MFIFTQNTLQVFQKFYFIKNLNLFIYVSFLFVGFVSGAAVEASVCREVLTQIHRKQEVSLERAQDVIRRHHVTSTIDYRKRYQIIAEEEGIKLPRNPAIFYKEWKNWRSFLGKTRPERIVKMEYHEWIQ